MPVCDIVENKGNNSKEGIFADLAPDSELNRAETEGRPCKAANAVYSRCADSAEELFHKNESCCKLQ